MLVDSHCHLPLIAPDPAGQGAVVARAHAVGVAHILCVGVDLETLPDVLAAAHAEPSVSASVGVHPNTADAAREPSIDELVNLATANKVVAIGETGLDYYRSQGDLEWQRARFRTHIRAARIAGKPLVVHCRDAAADLLAIMREERAQDVGGVMHCFVDSWETASAALDLGFLISFSGIVTFKNAADLRAIAARVPLERLLVETDAPWLAPVPRRGQINEPAFVRHTATLLAEMRGLELTQFARTTTDNFCALFGVEIASIGAA